MAKKNYHIKLKGYVGGWNFDANYVDYMLDKHKDEEVHVLINSLGGSVATALSVSAAFARHGNVHVHYESMNASAATIASLGAKRVTIDRDAMYLVHKCSQVVFLWDQMNADQLQQLIEQCEKTKRDLDKIDLNIASGYARRCKKEKAELLDLMKEQPDEWYSPNDVMLKILALEDTTISAHYSILVFYPPYEEYNNNLTNDYSGRSITVDRYTQEFGYTGLQSFAMLMASLGIFQVALNLKAKRQLSPYDSVEYIRLTPLGRYALGLTDDYDPPQLEHTAYFELDPDRLIIRSLTQPNPYEQLLSDTSTPISKNRFETSATSFLANCSSRSDVENKISTFRQFIASDLPPLWEQFFNQLLQHIHPLHEDTTPYKHFTLQPDDHELISLITTDPVLRQIVIRAEGYRIMVLATDMKKFTDRMKKHGYLL